MAAQDGAMMRHFTEVTRNYRDHQMLGLRHRFAGNRRVVYHAQEVMGFIRSQPLPAGRAQGILQEFRDSIRRDRSSAQTLVSLYTKLPRYMRMLDELLFCGLLTQPVVRDPNLVTAGGAPVREPRIALRFRATVPVGGAQAFFDPPADIITLYLTYFESNALSIQALVHNLAHEMVHAFLDMFADETHPRHERWVTHDGGHGEMFLEILAHVEDRLLVWMDNDPHLRGRSAQTREKAQRVRDRFNARA
ncbi:hypothetical protein F4778DRAFT_721991 [Xylariomycetidae sp. FL2044]|nr:hypothetical protein F4778DRAFT_721991 [Xylariomycetidae sp. FL2044]